jgi:hypothetical protein
MKKGGRLSKNVIDMTDNGPNAKKAKNQKQFLLPTDGKLPSLAENRKAIAGRKKLPAMEKILLGGMDKAAEIDKTKVRIAELAKVKQMTKTLKDMAENKKIKPTPVKGPIPSSAPRKKKK